MTDAEYLELACMEAHHSIDPSSQNGAVLIARIEYADGTAGGMLLGRGHNRFPIGIAQTPERLADRAVKYGMVIHAEELAIINAMKVGAFGEIKGSTLYCPWASCRECAKKIIEYGIARLVIHTDCELSKDGWWLEERTKGLEMLREGGVVVDSTTLPPGHPVPPIRRNYELWRP
jgi:dCMP deaminase